MLTWWTSGENITTAWQGAEDTQPLIAFLLLYGFFYSAVDVTLIPLCYNT